MGDELRDLYQEVILEHARKPRNFRVIDEPGAHRAEGFNRLCGDRLYVYVQVEDGIVKDLSFQGTGCAISTASASMMTEAIRGRPVAEVLALAARFRALVTGEGEAGTTESMGELAALAGVRAYPMRVKCATLAWHALRSALEGASGHISTE